MDSAILSDGDANVPEVAFARFIRGLFGRSFACAAASQGS
jgi:hypothetical protein